MVFVLLLIGPLIWSQEVPVTGPEVQIPLELRSRVGETPGVLGPRTSVAEVPRQESAAIPTDGPEAIEREEVERNLTVRPGETVNVFFEGEGWVFEGAEPSLEPPQRERASGGTRFRFTPRAAGDYLLRFQRQDPRQGRILAQRVRIVVRSETSPTPSGFPMSEYDHQSFLERARALFRAGRFPELYRHLGSQSRDESVELSELRAVAAAGVGRPSEALEHWARAVELAEADRRPRILARALSAAARLGDGLRLTHFWTLLETGYADQRLPDLSEETLGDIGEGLYRSSPEVVPALLDLWPVWFPEGRLRDRWLFLAARYWETQRKDYREALRFYTELAQDHPLSPHHRTAQEKSALLRARLFSVR